MFPFLYKKNLIARFANILEFYKTTLPVNLTVCIIPFILGGFEAFEAVFLSFGFFMSLVIKELHQKNNYLFYYNNGIPKIQLWIYAYIVNFFSLALLLLSYNLISRLF